MPNDEEYFFRRIKNRNTIFDMIVTLWLKNSPYSKGVDNDQEKEITDDDEDSNSTSEKNY